MKELKINQKVPLMNGDRATVLKKLGEGGQGAVYLVDVAGMKMALKWYKDLTLIHNPAEFYRNLERNILHGAPSPAFLWPEYVTEKYDDGHFGYVMKLCPEGYHEYGEFIMGRVKFGSFRARIIAAKKMVEGYRLLHRAGLSYQDLNDGNCFINPASGDVLICDNDNAFPFGSNSGIGGKMRYMAPEVVTGRNMPDTHTDRFSLALILFNLFYGNHPFEGVRTLSRPCLTEGIEKEEYGSNILFIMDPVDPSNRPVKNIHVNVIKKWGLSPKILRDTFIREFSREKLLVNRQSRMTETEWLDVLEQVNDLLVRCPSCGEEIFYSGTCPSCGRDIRPVGTLQVERRSIPLFPNQLLFLLNPVKPDARTIVSRKDGRLYIQNGTGATWSVETPSGRMVYVNNGETVPVNAGLAINLNQNTKATIQ